MNDRQKFEGCTEFREWLESQGFKVSTNSLANKENLCNWYAYRMSTITARECECNDGKSMQIVVKPFKYWSIPHESAEVEVTGERGGIWYNLRAYSLHHNEVLERLNDIETSLISAWNAL
jgi:hypothetical protein